MDAVDFSPALQLVVQSEDERSGTDLGVSWQKSRRGSSRLRGRCPSQLVSGAWHCLANEEVVDGKSEIGGFPVVRRPMRQWMLRITAYAERLLDELAELDWPQGIKLLQRNWIGRSEGAEIDFRIAGIDDPGGGRSYKVRVFTTRPDTLYG